MPRRRVVKIVLLVLLGLAFVAFGIWVHAMMPVPLGSERDTEVYSFDYLGHAKHLSNCLAVGYGRFRHPLFSWVMAPVTLFGHRVLEAMGEQAFWGYLCVVFSLVMLGCVALLYRLLRRGLGLEVPSAAVCTALFVSFGHVWLLAGIPETFGLSMLIVLAMLNWMLAPRADRRLDLAAWGGLAVLAGGVTLTQGAKVCVAYCLTRRPTRRQIAWGVVGSLLVVALVVLVFYVRLRIRVHNDATARGLEGAVTELFGPMVGFRLAPGEWLHRFWVFFSEPVIVRGEPFDVRTIDGGYCSWVQPVLLEAFYALVGACAWLARRHPVVPVLGAMFLVDVCIHFVLGWGLAEGQLYSAHWFYSLPVLVGLGMERLRCGRRALTVLVGIFALAILLCNCHGYFGHDVGLVWTPE